MQKKDLVPSAIKTSRQYDANEKSMYELEQELAALTQDTDKKNILKLKDKLLVCVLKMNRLIELKNSKKKKWS